MASVLLVLVLGLAGGFVYLSRSGFFERTKAGRTVAKSSVLKAWRDRNYDQVLKLCEASIQIAPMDSFYLSFAGLSSFYRGSELPDGEERAAMMDQSVALIRKAFVVADRGRSAELPRAQLEYVLGKAYYDKGPAFWDECAKWIEASIQDHFVADDSWEFLAVAWDGLGDKARSLRYFEAALQRKRSDLLLIAAGKAYAAAGQDSRAESLLLEALAKSGDALAREKCRFLLMAIYDARNEPQKAQEQLDMVIAENPQSAEAHYRLGLLLQKQGDNVAARAQWRRAVAIDPMHIEARQKLAEKL